MEEVPCWRLANRSLKASYTSSSLRPHTPTQRRCLVGDLRIEVLAAVVDAEEAVLAQPTDDASVAVVGVVDAHLYASSGQWRQWCALVPVCEVQSVA